jgi:hypothetical protein
VVRNFSVKEQSAPSSGDDQGSHDSHLQKGQPVVAHGGEEELIKPAMGGPEL